MRRVERATRLLSRLYPWPVDASADLDRALRFLDATIDPETVVRAGYGAAILALPAVALALVAAPPSLVPLVGLVGVGCLLGVVHAVHAMPRVLATARRTRALGETPALVGRVVLRARLTPAAETAAAFAADTGRGPLADSLGDHVRRAGGRAGSGLPEFSAEWAEWFPALRRALLLVESAATAPDGERERTLDRALRVVLDGTRDRMTEFAAGLQGPTTALYAFGVVLPLALVALLPAARATGVPLPLSAVVFLYDFALPGVILVASAWLLARRPVTFPPPAVDRTHPDLPDRRWPPVVAGAIAGIVGWLAATGVVAGWAGPVAALGCGLGVGLVVRYRPVMAVRDRVQAVESGLADALYYVGRRVEEGRAVEAAVADAADEVPDTTGEVFADATRRQRQLKVGVREAFLGEHGALAHVPSTRTRSAVALLALAAREGRPAGGAVVTMADNLAELASVERDARHEIATVTSTLANTAAVFGPLVAGATVALAASMEFSGVLAASTGPAASGLGLAVGGYVLVLAALLATLSTGLSHGLDRALVGYRVGWALLAASATYLATFFAVGTLV